MIWQFVILLATHWFADFVCQTHWQAANKSKNNVALGRHVSTYTMILGVMSVFLFDSVLMWSTFVIANAGLHFVTDYFTSRWSSRHFKLAMAETAQAEECEKIYGDRNFYDLDPARHWHNFFVVIGLDQLIHQVTLAGTFWLAVQQ